jgi:hypothetical protein
MKKFEQLHIHEQLLLLTEMLTAVLDAEVKTIEEAAQKCDKTPLQWWRDLCADNGLDPCEPWPGFPGSPKNLPPAPSGDRPLPESVAHQLNKLFETQNRN